MQIAGFRPISFVYAPGLPEAQRWVIVDSLTLSMGDAVQVLPSVTISGIEPADAASDSVYGYLVGFVTPKNLPLELAKTSDYDGTFTESPSGHTYVASADNTTDKKIAGIVIPAFGVKVSALLDAAKGTTAGSDLVGVFFDILTTDSRKLDESTVSTTFANYVSLPGRKPSDPTDPADPTTTRIIAIANETEPGVGTAS